MMDEFYGFQKKNIYTLYIFQLLFCVVIIFKYLCSKLLIKIDFIKR
ncbi:hypothetical protein Premu_2741 [Hallella multisaccharivorax DSM 17128]|uniref:Uncharacterized protein n=1 Tax=Hallella multisaccharivorax DSM 17128 TaxID=688246 RepID=F8NCQ6_9BACT|nr:hypothetical protein Premu_2741 [Hallella multisaccharivorax DSM 17128]